MMTEQLEKDWRAKAIAKVVREFAGTEFEAEAVAGIEAQFGPLGADEVRAGFEALAEQKVIKSKASTPRVASGVEGDGDGVVTAAPSPTALKVAEAGSRVPTVVEKALADGYSPPIGGGGNALAPKLVAQPLVPSPPGRQMQLQYSPRGKWAACLESALAAFDAMVLDCRYDVFHDEMIIGGYEGKGFDEIAVAVRRRVLNDFGFDPGEKHVRDGLKTMCQERSFDPVVDYLAGLEWDGKARIDEWLMRYGGATATELNSAIGRKMLVAAARRARSPGVKFDYIPVFEADQGAGKSSLLRVMAGDPNFSDAGIIGLDKRAQQEAVQGVWIYEIPELAGFDRADTRELKAFASRQEDQARPAYAHSSVKRPRRCIFVATTNEYNYLKDTTGNRRYWPTRLGARIDLEGIVRDRDQLWAEAAMIEAGGEALVIPEKLWPDAAIAQGSRMEVDPWEDVIRAKLDALEAGRIGPMDVFVRGADDMGEAEFRVGSTYLLAQVLGISQERQHNTHTKRLAGVMRGLGYTLSKEALRFKTKGVQRGYTKPVDATVHRDVTGATGNTSAVSPSPRILLSSYSPVTPVTPVTTGRVYRR